MHRLHDIGEYMKEKVSTLGGEASGQLQHGAGVARDWFEQTLDEYPLAMGAAFFTLGLASGFALPSTRPENRLLGSARDRVLDKAQDVSSELIDRGEQVAEEAVGYVKRAVGKSNFDEAESP